MRRHASLGYQVNHLARLLALALQRRIAVHGVVPGQFAQLLALYEHDGLTQRELCELVQIDQSTMAHTLQRMQRDGLIERTPDPDDRRRARITLTDRARQIRAELISAAQEVNAAATDGFSRDESDQLLTLVGRAIANLEARAGEYE